MLAVGTGAATTGRLATVGTAVTTCTADVDDAALDKVDAALLPPACALVCTIGALVVMATVAAEASGRASTAQPARPEAIASIVTIFWIPLISISPLYVCFIVSVTPYQYVSPLTS